MKLLLVTLLITMLVSCGTNSNEVHLYENFSIEEISIGDDLLSINTINHPEGMCHFSYIKEHFIDGENQYHTFETTQSKNFFILDTKLYGELIEVKCIAYGNRNLLNISQALANL